MKCVTVIHKKSFVTYYFHFYKVENKDNRVTPQWFKLNSHLVSSKLVSSRAEERIQDSYLSKATPIRINQRASENLEALFYFDYLGIPLLKTSLWLCFCCDAERNTQVQNLASTGLHSILQPIPIRQMNMMREWQTEPQVPVYTRIWFQVG